ncbi:carboxylesterase/lipase family protein [Mycolicibacterium smegmatis]|uniref:Carboxylic ester hydrolase n=2 Tax=Mycolicibacterium smegmatis TaxID=1772 RepID=A0R5T4_MYCS2|nr:para-nitrobenzyl esterase [Mycolicibacterium smegmatis MC2 155]TBM51293.1 carboxylesterase/lipase family protein [Mycolicibacterium smegmatis]TBH45371.1 carboxylesterase/lipase family protein [Mycolicibacterium smegmatis MC2 155]TBM56432.1 carboxylesterase/lipase family protein [Mycolicibacterium smegmatis]TBM67395.1 carboxylesterase/lipase family protein [Mycolicibacterium smegmatis]
MRVEEEDGLVRARGLRYGTAARFTRAEPTPLWEGVLDATRSGPACPQRPSRVSWMTGPLLDGLVMDEDCLVLSVTAPADANGLPVMVWLHGGAYVSGSGESRKYDAAPLARHGDVVVVNVSYRLGTFGFLAPPGAPDGFNVGLTDQILALKWVRDNISAFGGDPGNVTVFGQSAGGDSVVKLMLAEEASGLFHRAIVQSAPLGLGDERADLAVAMRSALADALDGVDPLQATTQQLLDAQAAAASWAQPVEMLGAMMPFAPLLGHDPLPPADDVAGHLADAAARIELLVGYTRDDAAPFVTMHPEFSEMPDLTEFIFGAPAEALAAQWNDLGGRAASYRFEWSPDDAPLGACHCLELPFLFGSPEAWADAAMLGNERRIDPTLADEMRTVWTQFAHHGVDALPARSLRFG